jgi:hypothetical protein
MGYRRGMPNTEYADSQVERLFSSRDLQDQLSALRQLVLDLMIEVESLRAVQLARPPAELAAYRRAYEQTVLQSHNSAGPWSGVHRIFWAWYGYHDPPAMTFEGFEDGIRREVALLRRMGATEGELADHVRRVEEHATRT